jgi:23S rRNA (cytidine1920-2'-O)/16S rRNA (cytidine1409-2'-O)-methyltransferase
MADNRAETPTPDPSPQGGGEQKVRADLLLVQRGLFESRAKAKDAIAAGKVTADSAPVSKPSELLRDDAILVAEAAHPWVGRAALKLDHALDLWPITVEGRVVLDVGASTGGFTEVCLARGARLVFAVDVGRGQLHPSLIAHPSVVSLEGVDARALTSELIPEPPQLIVCDASFIGLAKVLPAALDLADACADLVALIKPQFEVGPQRVGKGGVVKDLAVRAEAVEAVCRNLEGLGWSVRATVESPVTGADGNVEYLLWAQRA